MSDLISRNEFERIVEETPYDVFSRYDRSGFTVDSVIEMLEKCSVVDAAPVVHGEWTRADDIMPPFCTNCGATVKTPGYVGTDDFYNSYFKHCPNCGAKMNAKMDGGKR